MEHKYLIGATYACVTLLAANVIAADKSWDCGNGSWSDSSCWNPAGVPLAGDNALLTQSDSINRTVSYSSGTSPALNDLFVDSTGTGSMSFIQDQGSLSFANQYIGYQGAGTYNHTGGINELAYYPGMSATNKIYLGYSSTGVGIYNLSGTGEIGSGSGSNTRNIIIGLNGTGIFNQSGGSVRYDNDISLAENPGSFGTYNLSDGNVSTSIFNVGSRDYYADTGTAVLNQSGGGMNIGNLMTVGGGGEGSATYNMSGGDVDVTSDSTFSVGSTGTVNQSGGKIKAGYHIYSGDYNLSGGVLESANYEYINGTFNQTGGVNKSYFFDRPDSPYPLGFNVGTRAGDTGVYNLYDGSLETVNYSYPTNEVIGREGVGTFNQYGGTNSVNADLILAEFTGSNGTYNLSGTGELHVGDDFMIGLDGTGIFNQSGGRVDVESRFSIAENPGSTGIYNLSGGNANLNVLELAYHHSADSGTGILNQSGGRISLANHMFIGGSATGSATFNISDGSVRVESSSSFGVGATGTVNQSGGEIRAGFFHMSGDYNMSSGELETVNYQYINGTFNQTGGVNTTTSFSPPDSPFPVGFNVGTKAGDTGVYNLYDGSLETGDFFYGTNEVIGREGVGVFNQYGGTNTVNESLILAEVAGSSGTYNLNGGLLDATNIVVNSGGTFNFNGGTLAVDNFTGDLVNNGGTLAPGDSPGTTNIVGDYIQASTGIFEVEIGGLSQGDEYDFLNVTGDAYLGGTLAASLFDLGGGLFDVSLGDTFDILLAETIIGEFDILSLERLYDGLDWSVSYILDDSGTDSVQLRAVTEPSMALLIGTGLIGLIGVARRRKNK